MRTSSTFITNRRDFLRCSSDSCERPQSEPRFALLRYVQTSQRQPPANRLAERALTSARISEKPHTYAVPSGASTRQTSASHSSHQSTYASIDSNSSQSSFAIAYGGSAK